MINGMGLYLSRAAKSVARKHKLFIDQNKTNDLHWQSMVRDLIPVHRTNSVQNRKGVGSQGVDGIGITPKYLTNSARREAQGGLIENRDK